MANTTEEFRGQWANPSDILSLLLLIGGDIVQKAIAQLVGYRVRLPGQRGPGIPITPIAFSFGWAAYAFSVLLAATGDMRLMPTNDSPSVTVNCSNGFVRETRSWVLGRLLRDHEIRSEIDVREVEEGGRAESVRIDIFNLGPASTPHCDFVWWLGWVTVLAQIGIAMVPWAVYDDWGVMVITLCGSLLAAVTSSMRQWTQEKWASRKLQREKVTCLTRGNGHHHIMVLLGAPGAWDVETMATRTLVTQPETRWISLLLAMLWTCLLVSISGLREHTWFLVGIGCIGMLQNVFAAGVPRKPGASNFNLTAFSRARTIIGRRGTYIDDLDATVDLEEDLRELSDISLWASVKPKPPGSDGADIQDKQSPMPNWLATMSSEDGVPSWLKPAEAHSAGQSVSHTPRGSHSSSTCSSSRDTSVGHGKIIYAVGVHGALMELEKWVPTAGLAMVQIFFPAGLEYNDESIRDNIHKRFWRRAYHTKSVRKQAEEKRRAEDRAQASLSI